MAQRRRQARVADINVRGIGVDHRNRARRRSAALRVGILAVLSATVSTAALAGGMPAAANALTNNALTTNALAGSANNDAGPPRPTPASVSVDYSALDPASA